MLKIAWQYQNTHIWGKNCEKCLAISNEVTSIINRNLVECNLILYLYII